MKNLIPDLHIIKLPQDRAIESYDVLTTYPNKESLQTGAYGAPVKK